MKLFLFSISNKKLWRPLATLICLLLGAPSLHAQLLIDLTGPTPTYTQNFDGFDGTATTVPTAMPGWTLSGNTFRGAGCGAGSSGGIYAFGTGTDFALGYLPASGSPNDTFTAHVAFMNSTGGTITEVTIAYNFERWKPNTRLNGFSVYSDLGDVSALNQIGAGMTGAACTVITNAKTVTLTGLNVPDGDSFYVEFRGGRGTGTGSSQGIAIDDFSLSAEVYFAPTLTLDTLTDFGTLCLGDTSVAQVIPLTGTHLTGPVTVTSAPGFLLATSATGPFEPVLTLTPTSGSLMEDIYVFFAPVAATAYTDSITFSSSDMEDRYVAVTGMGNEVVPTITIGGFFGAVCEGTPVTFTAEATDEGSFPVYTWLVNGVPAGATGTTYTTDTLHDGDVISATLLSDVPCAADTAVLSNSITVDVLPVVTPEVTITASPDGVITPGTAVTFTATFSGGGDMPFFNWLVNGVSVGTAGPTFTTSTLADGDVVQAVLYTDAMCATADSALSNELTIMVSVGVPGVQAHVLAVYPNPGNGTFLLKGQLNSGATTAKLLITNAVGQTAFTATVPLVNGNINQQIDLHELPAGVYLLSLESGAVRQHLRLVIRK